MGRDVAIIGAGITKFGEVWDRSLRDLGLEAGVKAINDANIASEDIDALYVGIMSPGMFLNQEHVAPLIADWVGVAGSHIPATRVEAADASGGLAIREAWAGIRAGLYDVVVVGGAEKMTDVGDDEALDTLSGTVDQEWESFFGATLPSLYAMIARRHMYQYGTTREQLAAVAVKNHKHGAMNPDAQFQSAVDLKTVLNSGWVAEPLGVFDCAPFSDGAAALVLCEWEKAKRICEQPIKITGSAQAGSSLSLSARRDITTLAATRAAGEEALKMAGRGLHEVQVAEVHDSYSIGEILAVEDLGFCKKGEGGKFVESGATTLGGRIPINTSGGLKARGHPLGATGIAQAVEVVQQLRGKAGARQVKGARVGLTHNVGGTGGTCVVHILEGGA
jgi:acetyl-CoA C-acetyltransferase